MNKKRKTEPLCAQDGKVLQYTLLFIAALAAAACWFIPPILLADKSKTIASIYLFGTPLFYMAIIDIAIDTDERPSTIKSILASYRRIFARGYWLIRLKLFASNSYFDEEE